MVMKLYAHLDSYKTKTILIAAKYVGLDVDVPAGDGKPKAGKIPVLETQQGCIFTSVAIARYISRTSRVAGLYGQNLLENGMVDSWVEYCTHELETPLCTWVLPVMGVFPEVPEATKCAKQDVKQALSVLDKHLLHNTYMVGHQITLADISLCCALLDGFRLVLDEQFRKPFGNLMRWFNLCMAQPEFRSVLGDFKFCEAAPKGKAKDDVQPKKGKEPAAKKEAAPKKDAAAKKEKEPAASPKAGAKSEAKGKNKENKKQEAKEAPAQKSAEELAQERKAKIKKVVKEGGKRGVEIEGAADMGGLQFFCTAVDEPEGDTELLDMSMDAMNAEADPTQEERKGGSGAIGKMLFSAGVEQLAIAAYLPEAMKGKLDVSEWLTKVVSAQGGEVLAGSNASYARGIIKADSEKGKFPLKLKEPCITEAIAFLKSKGLFPDADSDDDEMVFGDDDFPEF